jgi:hypothetical protein
VSQIMNYNSELEIIFQGQLKWDRRRIKFLAAFIITLIKVKTVNLVDRASANSSVIMCYNKNFH